LPIAQAVSPVRQRFNIAMSTIDQTRLLQMRSSILGQNSALQKAAGRVADSADAAQGGFDKTMVDALKAVNEQQSKAGALSEAYERGDTHDIVQVMVERQKASLGFEATLQVRNKLLSAYRDIMNMPV
jgi:flagellar hook-basal body complex protein FliE